MSSGILWIGDWMDSGAGLDLVAKRKIPILTPAANRSPVVQPAA